MRELESVFDEYSQQETVNDEFQIHKPSSLSLVSSFLPVNDYDVLNMQNIPREILESTKSQFSNKD